MSQLSELVTMESQISELRESIQESYSTVEFENSELGDFVAVMVENISQPECLQALVRFEQIATDNYIPLKEIECGVALPQTESTVICAKYVNSYDTVCYYELDIDITLDDVVNGIYSVYKESV